MKLLLDTSVCVWALRGREDVLGRLASLSPASLAVSAMCVAELRHGVLKGKAADGNAKLDNFLGVLEVLPFDRDAAEHHARARRALELIGRPVGERDLVIASTALAAGRALATTDLREFRRVPGLTVDDWSN